MPLFGHYINEEGLAVLDQYKYVSGGWTYMDTALNPFWNAAVEFVPLWVAPNVLTLIALMCTVGAGVLCFTHMPTFTEIAPAWVYFAIGLLVFMYQTLDAIDGKQARRTSSSSPLGQLFDHGCDSLATTMLGVVACAVMSVGTGQQSFWLISLLQGPYFIFTWWEIHMHHFKTSTGAIGVTEGQLCLIVLSFIVGIFGMWPFQFSLAPVITPVVSLVWPGFHDFLIPLGMDRLTVRDLLVVSMLTSNTIIVLHDYVAGCFKSKNKLLAITQPFALFAFVFFSYLLCNSGLPSHCPMLCYGLMALFFSIMAARETISATCKVYFSPIQLPLLPYFAACATIYYFPLCPLYVKHNITFTQLVNFTVVPAAVWGVIYFADFLHTSIGDICKHLNINCFVIKKKAQ